MTAPAQGDVWYVDLDPIRGREQAGHRPCMVISADAFNAGPADLVIVCPITSTKRAVRSHIAIKKGEAGLPMDSYVMSEAIRSIAKERLGRHVGRVHAQTLVQVQQVLRHLLTMT